MTLELISLTFFLQGKLPHCICFGLYILKSNVYLGLTVRGPSWRKPPTYWSPGGQKHQLYQPLDSQLINLRATLNWVKGPATQQVTLAGSHLKLGKMLSQQVIQLASQPAS